MTIELLSTLAGGLLSVLFSYFPVLSTRYDLLDQNQKRYVMVGALLVVSLGVYGLNCAGFAAQYGLPPLSCDTTGFWGVVQIFVYSLIANQAAHRLTPTKTT